MQPDKIQHAILKILNKAHGVMGSCEIARQLKNFGIDVTERTVRYHLKLLDVRGHTRVYGKRGRRITDLGRRELQAMEVFERATFVISRIEYFSCLTTFDPSTGKGDVIVNVSFIPQNEAPRAIGIMQKIYAAGFGVGKAIGFAREGELIGDVMVPEGKVGIATICSITINGVLLHHGIPVSSHFGAVIEMVDSKPERFAALVNYEGASLDPHELFIRARMTNVLGVVQSGFGAVLGSYREVPAVTVEKTRKLLEKLSNAGIGGVLIVGEPNRPVLGVTPTLDRAGIVVLGGFNPIAALVEMGIDVQSAAMATLLPVDKLLDVFSIKI